ncbi:MAG: enoyl-CoA hydratase-related protein [Bacteroidales bacterium]|nr:enoyl-CoA hydratase-related protein [Bacteroidales bacterium]
MEINFQTLQTEIIDKVLHVKLNRPEVRNAMNSEMIEEITRVFRKISGFGDIRALVIRGNGKAFCAGADLNYMQSVAKLSYEENLADSHKLAACFQAVYDCELPVIAYVHGSAMGGAIGLIAACDIIIAESETRFSFSELKLGLVPATIAPFVISRCGAVKSIETMLSARIFYAPEAEKMGLVSHSVPEKEMEKWLSEYLVSIKSGAPLAQKICKQMLRKLANETPSADISVYTSKMIAGIRAADEGQEGMNAFFEKRKPKWSE